MSNFLLRYRCKRHTPGYRNGLYPGVCFFAAFSIQPAVSSPWGCGMHKCIPYEIPRCVRRERIYPFRKVWQPAQFVERYCLNTWFDVVPFNPPDRKQQPSECLNAFRTKRIIVYILKHSMWSLAGTIFICYTGKGDEICRFQTENCPGFGVMIIQLREPIF